MYYTQIKRKIYGTQPKCKHGKSSESYYILDGGHVHEQTLFTLQAASHVVLVI